MKKILYFAFICSIAILTSCDTDINEEMYYATVGKNKETTPPGEVIGLRATPSAKAVTLNWSNPDDFDLSGITISVTPATGSLAVPITYKKSEMIKIPTAMTVTGLAGGVNYTFKVTTFDYNNNKSNGVSVSCIAEGDNNGGTGNFDGTETLFTYKKDYTAFDFGYCPTPTDKTISLTCKNELDLSGTVIDDSFNSGSGSYSIVSCPSGTIKNGENISVVIRYNPASSSTPSWDEVDLVLGGDVNNKIRLIGSNYKQPNNVRKSIDGKNYGLALWLRADMITSDDLTGTAGDQNRKVKRFPDYSGRKLHAINTDSSYTYAPTYMDSDEVGFNGLPGLNFAYDNKNSLRAQFLAMGSASDPIINSSKGSTTFVVMITPVNPDSTTMQTIISCNYGQSYPTLVNTYRYYDESNGTGDIHNGWGVKGSGLYGTYRYPCETNSTTDPNNKWQENVPGAAVSICMQYDQTIKPDVDAGSNDFPSNIRMFMNGKERLLAYIYSNNTTTDKQPLGLTYSQNAASFAVNCYGAYGKPIGDGKGHRYGGLSQCRIPSADMIRKYYGVSGYSAPSEAEKKIYERWILERATPTERAYDFAYQYNPYVYVDSDGTLKKSVGRSYASSDDGCPGGAYFNNWISNEDRRNGTIYSVIIGTDNAVGTYCRGKIAEVIMFDYALSSEELSEMNKYIYNRYKIGTLE